MAVLPNQLTGLQTSKRTMTVWKFVFTAGIRSAVDCFEVMPPLLATSCRSWGWAANVAESTIKECDNLPRVEAKVLSCLKGLFADRKRRTEPDRSSGPHVLHALDAYRRIAPVVPFKFLALSQKFLT